MRGWAVVLGVVIAAGVAAAADKPAQRLEHSEAFIQVAAHQAASARATAELKAEAEKIRYVQRKLQRVEAMIDQVCEQGRRTEGRLAVIVEPKDGELAKARDWLRYYRRKGTAAGDIAWYAPHDYTRVRHYEALVSRLENERAHLRREISRLEASLDTHRTQVKGLTGRIQALVREYRVAFAQAYAEEYRKRAANLTDQALRAAAANEARRAVGMAEVEPAGRWEWLSRGESCGTLVLEDNGIALLQPIQTEDADEEAPEPEQGTWKRTGPQITVTIDGEVWWFRTGPAGSLLGRSSGDAALTTRSCLLRRATPAAPTSSPAMPRR